MDWQLTCRACLETGDMVSLFDWDENNDQLCDKYSYLCGIEVSKDDSLPTLICLNCVDRLTYAHQFKQQCLSSNETLKECLDEFLKTSSLAHSKEEENSQIKSETETITIKQENGLLLQYELPVEHDPQGKWTRRVVKTPTSTVVTKAPGPEKRGRPRKYPNTQGRIAVSPYQRKKPRSESEEPESLTSLLASGFELKQEPMDGETHHGDDIFEVEGIDSDPDFNPTTEDLESEKDIDIEEVKPRKRGRPRKKPLKKEPPEEDDDALLKETILAFSEPIPEHILNPKPKQKKKSNRPKKKYVYDKTHVCETCGASFTSNSSLQTHIRRHLGIKPYVCSVCCYTTAASQALRKHMMRHTGEKPYPCRKCGRTFRDCGSRQKHERLHMGIRPYQCSLCGKAFTYSYVLANHMLTHTGEKKYTCEICNKKFTKAHHLKYHNKVHHRELYMKQQMEQEAKKLRQQMNITNLTGVLSGRIVDGTLQLDRRPSEEGEVDEQMQVVVEEANDQQQETDRAVADMQIVLESDFAIPENSPYA
ncbi:zinc finger and BTB domain-containing protein 17-like isoform X2 [Leptidea sinapis]|uniref:zinc finger and BTB domain-containing protein 17-like isoform X2 n=1 Tax=Leptidea sinapis TaxID=189913 RepID=UPI00213441E8|nr:zinc finger and BTB domain-containing protein 17-like isoform X2 [Leptidea sinapis]